MQHGALGMRAGRKRNQGVRYPSGDIVREREYSPLEVKRLRDAAMRGLRDPEWGTELGRLFLENRIPAALYAAGKRWAIEAATYRSAIDIFPIRSTSLEVGIKSHPPDPDSEDGQEVASKDRAAVERFFAAHAVLISAGMGAESAVRALCEEGRCLAGDYERRSAIAGLVHLAEHYRLTDTGKSDTGLGK